MLFKKKNKKIDINSLYIGKLIAPYKIICGEEILTTYGMKNINYWKENKVTQEWDLVLDEHPDILIVDPERRLFKTDKKVTEYLTGEQFDYKSFYDYTEYKDGERVGKVRYITERKEDDWDAYVRIDTTVPCKPNSSDLLEYVEDHIDVDEYREELRRIKAISTNLRLESQNSISNKPYLVEKSTDQIEYDLKERILLLPEIVKQYRCSEKATKVLFDVVKDESYLVPTPIDKLLKRIKDKYKGLNNNEYLSVVGVILKLQLNEEEKYKEYLKI